nr:MAG TPA: hypothetical protein [Caudoviricetes sp.]
MSNSRRFSYVLTVWNPVRFLCAQRGDSSILSHGLIKFES